MLLVALPLGAVFGQSSDLPAPGQLALKLSDSMKANAKQIAGYTWKNTLEINKEGSTVSTTVNQVRIGSDGKPEMTLVSQEPPAEKKRGLRGKKQEKEQEYIESLVKLGIAYAHPEAGNLVDFFEASTFALGSGKMTGYVQVQGKDLVQDGDEVTMWIHADTYQPYMTEFRTKLDGDLVTGSLSYGSVGDEGPYYVAKQVVGVDDKKLQTVIQNSDFSMAEQN